MIHMKKVLALALVLIVIWSMTACAAAEPAQTTYRDILLGNGEFRYNGGPVTLDTFMEGEDETAQIYYFTVMDFDGDGAEEVLVQFSAPAGDAGGYLVLHQSRSGIAGFRLSPRTAWNLKEDGTFEYSQPAGTEYGIASLAFEGESCSLNKHLTAAGEQFAFSEYTVNGAPATEEAYFAAIEEQAQKPDAQWHDFTKEAVANAFPQEKQ